MSKEEHEESIKKQKSDDIKLQLAIEESRKHADEVGSIGKLVRNSQQKRRYLLHYCINPLTLVL